jgi:hypothetical protein
MILTEVEMEEKQLVLGREEKADDFVYSSCDIMFYASCSLFAS